MKENDVEHVKTLFPEGGDPSINSHNSDGETCLHIAMKSSNKEMVKLLISKCGDLAIQDNITKNIPLHNLVERAASDESNMAEVLNIWKIVVDNAAIWWRKKYNLESDNERDHRIYQRDALYNLRSEIPNKDKLSVIQLAATRGLVRVVKEMIWVENVFVEQSEKNVIINVTNLVPHLKGGDNKEGYCGCLLDTILEMEHSNKANEILNM